MKVKIKMVSGMLPETLKEEIWQLYQQYYYADKAAFIQVLEKNNLYALYTVNENIIGFTGLRMNKIKINGKKRLLIFFRQTVIQEAFRGKSLISLTGAKLCIKYWKECLLSEVYFGADTLTYKAYLVFTKTLEEIYPSYKHSTPKQIKKIIDHLGSIYLGTQYCPQTGIVQREKLFVRPSTMHVPFKYRLDEDISFYLEKNPFYQQGKSLVTVAPVNWENIKKLLNKYVRKRLMQNALSSFKVYSRLLSKRLRFSFSNKIITILKN